MIRNKCVVCGGENLFVFLSYDMPVYNSDIDPTSDFEVEKMNFSECEDCNCVQLKNLVDPSKVYQHNHNQQIVGSIWDNHYYKFKNFIGDINKKNILEISDPSAKIAKISEGFQKWYIVEPHSSLDLEKKNIFFIKKYFDNDFEIEDKLDLIIHSHFFEHTYDPINFFEKCNSLLSDDGKMYASIPNLESILNSGYNPNSVLSFEHTFFYDIDILNFIANKSGFKVEKMEYYLNHSIFIEFSKSKEFIKNVYKFNKYSQIFLDSYNSHLSMINYVNEQSGELILFGCHVSSQFLIYNGLQTNKIKFIVDNSKDKQNKILYGTNLLTHSPDDLIGIPYKIIVSHMGVYANEIRNGLLEKNNQLTFL